MKALLAAFSLCLLASCSSIPAGNQPETYTPPAGPDPYQLHR